jgi:hypothetical protein
MLLLDKLAANKLIFPISSSAYYLIYSKGQLRKSVVENGQTVEICGKNEMCG